MATEKPRFTITIDTDTLGRVEDYRYSHRIGTQSKAILDLVRMGLDKVGSLPHYENFTHKEVKMIEAYRSASADDKLVVDTILKKYLDTEQQETASAG